MASNQELLAEPAGAEGAGAAAYQRYRDTSFFSNLNGLRFICIALVLWHHAPISTDYEWLLFGRGFLGVDFFFVLSGYLITTLLLREQAKNGFISLKGFYFRRALRIFPVYFFVVGAISAYYIVIKGQYQYLEILPGYIFFMANFSVEHIPMLGITWSLAVEEQFYLIWPLMLVLLPTGWIAPFLGLFIALNVGGAFAAFYVDPIPFNFVGPMALSLPNSTYAPILIGSLLAVGLHRPGVFAALWRWFGGGVACVWLFGLLFLIFVVAPGDVRGLPNLAIHLTMAAILASLVMREDTAMTPFLAHPAIARIGEISYGVYLYHLIGLHIANIMAPKLGLGHPVLVTIVYVLISIVISEISYRTLEAYFRRFRPT